MLNDRQKLKTVFPGLRLAWVAKLVSLLLLVLPAAVQAQFNFTTNNGVITITGYTGTNDNLSIPSTTNGLPVTSIGTQAFNNIPTLISVTIPNSITNFGWTAFNNCTNLLGVYFQGNAPVDFFPGAAPVFNGDNNATLYYLQGTTGWKSTFDLLPTTLWNPQVLTQLIYTTNNNAITITGYNGSGGVMAIPITINGIRVAGIGSNAFFNCGGLTNIVLPNTVTNVGDFAFAGCTNLTSITVPNSIFGSGVFSNCTALTNVIIPNNVTSIGQAEFFHCTALNSLTIPGSVTNIGAWAFQNCYNLSAVYFQSNAPVVDPTMFDGDNNTTNYYFPKTAGWGAALAGRPTVPVLFTYTTNSGAITITKYIGIDGAVTIPKTINGLPVTTIGNVTFYQCTTLTNITIGSNVTSIAGQAFVSCPNLLAINVDALNPVYSSVDGVLFNKSQTALTYYPGGRTGSYAIPNGVTQIPSYAFQSCPSLTSLTVPNSVTSIGSLAFNVDPSLVAIYFQGNAPTVASFGFSDIQGAVTVFYLLGTTGWDTNLGGLPTALWKPQLQINDGSFGVQTNQFGFNIAWASGQTVVVEACTNFANPVWQPVQTNTLSDGTLYFCDPQWTNYPGRFYRLRFP